MTSSSSSSNNEKPQALVETKTLIKLHTSTLYQWANAASDNLPVPAVVKEALLGICARLFETIEMLPDMEVVERKH